LVALRQHQSGRRRSLRRVLHRAQVTTGEHLSHPASAFDSLTRVKSGEYIFICFLLIVKLYLFVVYYLRIENAEGNVLFAVYLFIYLFICMRVPRITQKVLNRIA